MSEYVIELENVVKQFHIYTSNMQKIKGVLFSADTGMVKQALSGINLQVKKGETVAIVGSLASGRSTLMKVISGITAPTQGKITVNGKITSVFDLRTGFDGELTGRQNLYIRGALIGMSRKEIKEKEEDIIKLAELENVIDLPMKNWKTGYSSRLGFAISFVSKPEILLIDDPLSVRDKVYKDKVLNQIASFQEDGETTILMVTNQLPLIKTLCTRALFIEGGLIKFDGTPEETIAFYKKNAKKAMLEEMQNKSDEGELESSEDYDDEGFDY